MTELLYTEDGQAVAEYDLEGYFILDPKYTGTVYNETKNKWGRLVATERGGRRLESSCYNCGAYVAFENIPNHMAASGRCIDWTVEK